VPLLQVENVSVFYGKAQALENVSIHVHSGRIRLGWSDSMAPAKPLCSITISGFLPYSGEIVRGGEKLRDTSPARIARSGIVQWSGIARIVRRDERARESGSRRPASDRRSTEKQLEWLFDLFPILKERQSQLAQTLSGGEQQMLAIVAH